MIVAGDIFGDIFSTIGNVLGGAASSAATGIITVFAHAVLGSLTRAIEWLSTVWMNTPTPTLVDASGTATGTVAWMQGELLPLTAALAVGSVIVGGARIAVAEAGHTEAREFTRWLFVYALASAGGVAFAAMLISTCDGFANYIIAQATTGSNFGDHLAQGLGLATQAVGSGTLQPQGGFLLGLAGTGASAMLAIFIGAIALVASFVEFVLMAFRGGVLVILCGLIPLAAAFSNVPTGERWLRRIAGWIVALALYKLAAAFCYAAHYLDFRVMPIGAGSERAPLSRVGFGVRIITSPTRATGAPSETAGFRSDEHSDRLVAASAFHLCETEGGERTAVDLADDSLFLRVISPHIATGRHRLLQGRALRPQVALALVRVGAQPVAKDDVTSGLWAVW